MATEPACGNIKGYQKIYGAVLDNQEYSKLIKIFL